MTQFGSHLAREEAESGFETARTQGQGPRVRARARASIWRSGAPPPSHRQIAISSRDRAPHHAPGSGQPWPNRPLGRLWQPGQGGRGRPERAPRRAWPATAGAKAGVAGQSGRQGGRGRPERAPRRAWPAREGQAPSRRRLARVVDERLRGIQPAALGLWLGLGLGVGVRVG